MPPDDTQTTRSSAAQIEETRTPSQIITLDMLMNPLGNSGVFLVNGFLEHDYNAKLAGKVGIDVYDKMRKSDATVNALLQIVTLPIRSTEWYVEPGKDPEGKVGTDEEEIADFVHRALFEKLEQGWDDHLREVLTCLWAGFSVFEKVLKEEDDHIWLKKLGYRRAKSILRWEQSDGTAGVTQILPSPATQPDGTQANWVNIPAAKLLIFTFNREGDNYEGISMLRPAYKHYYIKDQLYKFDSVKHERQSVGVPYIKLPKGASTDDYNRAKAILKNFRAHEMTGLVMPDPSWEFGFCDLKAGDVSDLWKSIDHHSREILKSGLAQFLELGAGSRGSSGSRAVSTDQSGLFLQAIDAIAKMIEDVYSRFLIPELVDMNFDGVYRYPRLQHRRLEKIDLTQLAAIIQSLAAAGVITMDAQLEEWTRKNFDLPPKIEEDTPPTEDEPQWEDPSEEIPKGEDEMEAERSGQITPLGDGLVNPDDMTPPPAPGEEPQPGQPDAPGEAPPEGEPNTEDTSHELTPEEVQAEIDALDKKLKPVVKAHYYEMDSQVYAEIGGQFYVADGLTFGSGEPLYHKGEPVPDEVKQKISDALKAHYAANPKPKTAMPKAPAGGGAAPKVTNIAQIAGQRRRDRLNAAQNKGKPGAVKAPAAKPGAAPAQAQHLAQQRMDPHSPLYAGKKPAATASQQTKGTGTAKGKSGAAQSTKQAKADAKAQKAMLNPKGNPREKLQSIRSVIQNAKTPADKQAARDALVKLQKSLAPKMQKQQAAQVKHAATNTKKAASAAKKAAKAAAPKHAKGAKGTKAAKGKKAPKPTKNFVPSPASQPVANPLVSPKAATTVHVTGKKATVHVHATERGGSSGTGAKGRSTDDGEKLENPDHSDDAQPTPIAAHERAHEALRIYTELYDTSAILAAQRTVPLMQFSERPHWTQKKYAEPYTGWRALTFAEEKVNLSSLKNALQKAATKLGDGMDAITAEQKADLLAQVKRAVTANDIAAVGQIRAKYTGDLSAAIVDVQKQMFEQGMRSATGEMGVKMPVTSNEVKGAMRVQTDKLTQKLSDDMSHAASNAVTQTVAKKGGSITNTNPTEAIAAASDAIDQVVNDTAAINTLSIIGSLNLGRSSVFERYPEQVYAMQYSAIIDDVTTDLCLSLDGRVVEPGSDDYYAFTPPQHMNCRSIWVEIMQDEEFKPEIDGIPSSIEPNDTIDTAKDLEAPIVKANSPAAKLLQQELDDRTTKLKMYQDAGTFANRQASHQDRIDALKAAIEGNTQKATLERDLEIGMPGGATKNLHIPTGYAYHESTPEHEAAIDASGLSPMTNKRDSEARLYLAPDPSIASAASADQGDNTVLYRTKITNLEDVQADPHIPGATTFYVKHDIAPEDLEKFDPATKTWNPIK